METGLILGSFSIGIELGNSLQRQGRPKIPPTLLLEARFGMRWDLPSYKPGERRLLTVIIPTMNEPLIANLVARVHESLHFVDHEVVVVDKSKDMIELRSAEVVRQRSKGLGMAVLEGLKVASGEWIAVMDGDFSHRPEDLAQIIKGLRNEDFALGSRYASGGKNLDAPIRRVASRLFNLAARLFLSLRLSDPMSGMLVTRAVIFEKVKPNPIGFKVNLEVIYGATLLGFKGKEFPIIFRPRQRGKSKAGVREAVRTISYILALKFRRYPSF